MSRICPHCGHARPPSTTVPDWQCPACDKAYNKGTGAHGTLAHGGRVPKSRRAFSRYVLPLFLLVLTVWLSRPWWPAALPFGMGTAAARQEGPAAAQPEIILYATQWCGYCAATRRFFAEHDIRYLELDIEQSSIGRDGFRQLGGRGVPLILVGEAVVHGYDEAQLRRLLRPWLPRP